MANNYNLYDPNLAEYLTKISATEAAILAHIRREDQSRPGHQMQIGPEQAAFMSLLLQMLGARKALELGTYTGYSATAMALALPANGKLITCDRDEATAKIAQSYWRQAGVAHKIEFRLGQVADSLDKLIAEQHKNSFDFVFIDADKINIQNYYEKALILVRRGGLIAIDNVFRDGAVWDQTCQHKNVVAVRAFNEFLQQDQRVSFSVVPIADGLSLARKA